MIPALAKTLTSASASDDDIFLSRFEGRLEADYREFAGQCRMSPKFAHEASAFRSLDEYAEPFEYLPEDIPEGLEDRMMAMLRKHQERLRKTCKQWAKLHGR
jgi:hypothetical protein